MQQAEAWCVLHLATDWENYAEQMMEVLSANSRLRNQGEIGAYTPRPSTAHLPSSSAAANGSATGYGICCSSEFSGALQAHPNCSRLIPSFQTFII